MAFCQERTGWGRRGLNSIIWYLPCVQEAAGPGWAALTQLGNALLHIIALGAASVTGGGVNWGGRGLKGVGGLWSVGPALGSGVRTWRAELAWGLMGAQPGQETFASLVQNGGALETPRSAAPGSGGQSIRNGALLFWLGWAVHRDRTFPPHVYMESSSHPHTVTSPLLPLCSIL